MGGAKGGDGGTAAEADEIAEIGVGAQAEEFRDVAGRAGAEIASAGTNKEGVDFFRVKVGLGKGLGESLGGKGRRVGFEGSVELLRALVKHGAEIGGGELAGGDA